jgi:hypothetical protein
MPRIFQLKILRDARIRRFTPLKRLCQSKSFCLSTLPFQGRVASTNARGTTQRNPLARSPGERPLGAPRLVACQVAGMKVRLKAGLRSLNLEMRSLPSPSPIIPVTLSRQGRRRATRRALMNWVLGFL